MESDAGADAGPGYGYTVVRDGADEHADPLHETPFDGLEQARGFALGWLAEQGAERPLAVVRVYRGASGRRDTVAIVDPAAADVRSELESLRGARPGTSPGRGDAGASA